MRTSGYRVVVLLYTNHEFCPRHYWVPLSSSVSDEEVRARAWTLVALVGEKTEIFRLSAFRRA